jgi:hypothetical protein
VFDAFGVKRAGSPDEPMNSIALFKKQFGEIRAILAGYTGNKRTVHQSPLYCAILLVIQPKPYLSNYVVKAFSSTSRIDLLIIVLRIIFKRCVKGFECLNILKRGLCQSWDPQFNKEVQRLG